MELKILSMCFSKAMSVSEISTEFSHKKLNSNMKRALSHLKALGFLEPTIVDKPRSAEVWN